MRKAERLFQLINLLRGRKNILTAQEIADSLNVSVRTIYRDIQALSLSGVPIEGEAGVGYRLSHQYSIPPIMFSEDELTSLVLALKMVKGHSDSFLAQKANQVENKILALVPEEIKKTLDHLPYFVPDNSESKIESKWHPIFRESCLKRRKTKVHYIDLNGTTSSRILWPLGLMFWGQAWTLLSWCELRQDYRNFRLDRFQEVTMLEETYPESEEVSLEYYFKFVDKC